MYTRCLIKSRLYKSRHSTYFCAPNLLPIHTFLYTEVRFLSDGFLYTALVLLLDFVENIFNILMTRLDERKLEPIHLTNRRWND